jgi:hypothetical protein
LSAAAAEPHFDSTRLGGNNDYPRVFRQ